MIPKSGYRFSEKDHAEEDAAEYAGRNVRPRQPMEDRKAMAGSPDAVSMARIAHAAASRRLAHGFLASLNRREKNRNV
jgi:hypothetical protein